MFATANFLLFDCHQAGKLPSCRLAAKRLRRAWACASQLSAVERALVDSRGSVTAAAHALSVRSGDLRWLIWAAPSLADAAFEQVEQAIDEADAAPRAGLRHPSLAKRIEARRTVSCAFTPTRPDVAVVEGPAHCALVRKGPAVDAGRRRDICAVAKRRIFALCSACYALRLAVHASDSCSVLGSGREFACLRLSNCPSGRSCRLGRDPCVRASTANSGFLTLPMVQTITRTEPKLGTMSMALTWGVVGEAEAFTAASLTWLHISSILRVPLDLLRATTSST